MRLPVAEPILVACLLALSFFVLLAAVLLAFLLFKLYLGFRKTEIGTLTALGFSFPAIRKLFVAEASVFVLFGILLGIPFGIYYNHLILKAINTIWVDIVRTSIVDILHSSGFANDGKSDYCSNVFHCHLADAESFPEKRSNLPCSENRLPEKRKAENVHLGLDWV